jgi:hypothetical protein
MYSKKGCAAFEVCEDFTYLTKDGQITIYEQRAGMGKTAGKRVARGGAQ